MIKIDHDGFVNSLRPGDIGLIKANNFFAKLQALYASKFDKGALRASHGFYIPNPPEIIEANGIFVSQATVFKDIGDSTECWIFRNPLATPEQVEDMTIYCQAMVEGGAHYGILDIVGFGLQFFGIRKKMVNQGGVFCTELTSRAIISARIPFNVGRPPYAVDPSFQLQYFMSDQGNKDGWILQAHYDGKGNYFIEGAEQKEAA